MPQVEISVSLVRKAHGNLDAEKLMELDIIQLNNYGIEEIDNLEVFEQIRELHLSGNHISKIENLDFLRNLEYIDLSNNNINDDGLRYGIGRLPLTLQTIVLGGNPCCTNEELLCELNDSLPNLGIVIGLESQQTEQEKKQDRDQEQEQVGHIFQSVSKLVAKDVNDNDNDNDNINYESESESENESKPLVPDGVVLDADELLKSIVERKCSLQNVTTPAYTFNINNTIELLNIECNKVLEDVSYCAKNMKQRRGDTVEYLTMKDKERENNKKNKTTDVNSSSSSSSNSNGKDHRELMNVDLNAMLKNSKDRSSDSKLKMSSLKERMMKSRDEAMEKIKIASHK
jgi:hypothetical protein